MFFLDPRFRSVVLKKISFKRIIKCIASIGKRLRFDLYKIDILLNQLQQYKEEKDPFDMDLSLAHLIGENLSLQIQSPNYYQR